MTVTLVETLHQLGLEVAHVDTADRRGIHNIGQLDLTNVGLGVRHALQIWSMALRLRPTATILPVSQATLPLLRDLAWCLGPLATRSKLILHLHGAALTQFLATAPFLGRHALRWLGRRSWRGIVLTPGASREFEGLIPRERIRTVSNTVPDPGMRVRSVPARPGPFRVLYLSNLIRGKGYVDVLLAVAKLVPHIPDLEVVLAGEWYDGREVAERLLASEALAHRVRIAGAVRGAEKQALLDTSDVFVFPPTQVEGQPLVLLEAMAAGLPIVSTTSGLIPETVVEGRNARLVPKADPDALAHAILTLWQAPALRESMGRESRALYLERYTSERFKKSLSQLLGELPPRVRHRPPVTRSNGATRVG